MVRSPGTISLSDLNADGFDACRFQVFDPLLEEGEAERIVSLAKGIPSYKMYGEELPTSTHGANIPQRYEVIRSFVRRAAAGTESPDPHLIAEVEDRAHRGISGLFRGKYADLENHEAGSEILLEHPGLMEAARSVSACGVIVPRFIFANVLVPGMELVTHTDIPEFRGVDRFNTPHWMLVVMHHSRLFEEWRVKIVQAVCWMTSGEGGEFTFFPKGPDAAPVQVGTKPNTALVFDPDSCFHRIERVGAVAKDYPKIPIGSEVHFDAATDSWSVHNANGVVTAHPNRDVRLSIAMKYVCFEDEESHNKWVHKQQLLTHDTVYERLIAELKTRGRYGGEPPLSKEFATLICDEFFNAPA